MEGLLLWNKKGVSEMVGYVILIVIALGLSVMVYFYIIGFTPKDHLQCPEGVSLMLKDYKCSVINQNLSVQIYNNGRFNIDAVYVKLGDIGKTVRLPLNDPTTQPISLPPRVNYDTSYKTTPKKTVAVGSYILEIQPLIAQEGSSSIAVCSTASITQEIECS